MKWLHNDKEATLDDIKAYVGKGWGPLLESLVNDLHKLGWDGEVAQVKEKWGGLRFYIGSGTDEIFDRIDLAESESLKLCEDCGAPGVRRGGGWIRTLCDSHADGRKGLNNWPISI